jgi:8-oxo-dGTP pyrophosphatase MutT (NUDIX family)
MPEFKPIPRPAARVLLIDARERVLLIRAVLPPESPVGSNPGETYQGMRVLWLTPGGGLDPGESHEEAALRELWEESGVKDVELGPCVWRRTHVYAWNNALWEQQERYFVARVDAREAHMDFIGEDEVDILTELRWWTVEEIAASEEVFVPRKMGALLPPIIAGDYPAEVIDAGV